MVVVGSYGVCVMCLPHPWLCSQKVLSCVTALCGRYVVYARLPRGFLSCRSTRPQLITDHPQGSFHHASPHIAGEGKAIFASSPVSIDFMRPLVDYIYGIHFVNGDVTDGCTRPDLGVTPTLSLHTLMDFWRSQVLICFTPVWTSVGSAVIQNLLRCVLAVSACFSPS